ncbi:MAG: hypothetical protein QXR53_05030 [Candidatus Norongarragalinales archaeon]
MQKKFKRLLTKPGFHKFETPGDSLVCAILNGGVPRRQEGADYQVFDVVDEDGVPRIIMANTILKEALKGISEDVLVEITYKGEGKTKAGKQVKYFDVCEVEFDHNS